MHKKLNKLPAYTLIELVIVIAIIALTIVIAIPAFGVYGNNQAFSQKIEEVQLLMHQTYLFSKNPEKDVVLYELESTKGDPNSDPPVDNKFVLKKCFKIENQRCSTESGKSETVKEIILLKTQEVQFDDLNPPYLACTASPDISCFNSAVPFGFRDNKVSSPNIVSFTINNDPFSINSHRMSP